MQRFELEIVPDDMKDLAAIEDVAADLTADVRDIGQLAVRPAEALTPPPAGSKSGTAAEIGKMVIGGVFSAATVQSIARIAIAYANRGKVKSIRLRRGDVELTVTGSTKLDDPRLVELLPVILGVKQPDN